MTISAHTVYYYMVIFYMQQYTFYILYLVAQLICTNKNKLKSDFTLQDRWWIYGGASQ